MTEWQIIAAVFAVGAASYAMRSVGFLVAGALPQQGLWPRLLRRAPGNLIAAFIAAGILEGGLVSAAGCFGAMVMMAVTGREWAALAGGFAMAALVSVIEPLARIPV